ncbi:MAG: ACP S-malonyltransferase [Actinomycetota bacterium]|nr:ACP S-malonyltransferase [Actinomycetota bacterium]
MAVGVMFPGQGAQRAGLGLAWRDHPAWSVAERAEAALGRSFADLLLDPDASLERTEDAQLSVLLTSLMAWETVAPTLAPVVGFAGHSLGQVTALIAAGTLSFEDGIRLAARRAQHTQGAAERRPGEMLVLLGATPDQAHQLCESGTGECWLANDNAPGQVVVAGTVAGVADAEERAGSLGVRRATRLRVGGAFHTPLMADAANAFAHDLRTASLSKSSVPVVSNGDALAYDDGDGWRQRLEAHLVRPVRWRESVQTLVSLGATDLVEVGPGSILAGLARRIVPDVPVRGSESPLQEVSA